MELKEGSKRYTISLVKKLAWEEVQRVKSQWTLKDLTIAKLQAAKQCLAEQHVADSEAEDPSSSLAVRVTSSGEGVWKSSPRLAPIISGLTHDQLTLLRSDGTVRGIEIGHWDPNPVEFEKQASKVHTFNEY